MQIIAEEDRWLQDMHVIYKDGYACEAGMAQSYHLLDHPQGEGRMDIAVLPHAVYGNQRAKPPSGGSCCIFISVCLLTVVLILSVASLSFVMTYAEKLSFPSTGGGKWGTVGALIGVVLLTVMGLVVLLCLPAGNTSSCGRLLYDMSFCCVQMAQCCMVLPQALAICFSFASV